MSELNHRKQCLLIAAVVLLVLFGTRSAVPGDVANYAGAIVENLGKAPVGAGNPLWEFGHLLWRPIGWLGVTILSPLLTRVTDWTLFQQAVFVLTAISVLSSIAAAILWYLMLLDLRVPDKTAFLICIALAFSNGFLSYGNTGFAYIAGVACLTASVYCIRKGKVGAAALFYALATLIWLPYILAGPALVVLVVMPLDWEVPMKGSLKTLPLARAIRFTVTGLAAIVLVYGLASLARETRSAAEARAWYSQSSHGLSQSQTVARLVTGLPRFLLDLGKNGIVLKRFLRHDPYAGVGVRDVVLFGGVWKYAAFYLFLAALFYELWRRSRSSWPLLLLLAIAGPMAFFAVVLFEPSSAERFLPVLPFLVLVTGYIFRKAAAGLRFTQTIIAVFLLAVVASNGYSAAAPRMARQDQVSWGRIAGVRHRITPAGLVVLVTNQDSIEEFFGRSISGEVNRPQPLRVYDIVEPGTVRIQQWREEFSATILKVWNDGGEVWVTKRAWAPRPKPEWNWVERDDPLEVWEDLYLFMQPLKTDADLGESDGFFRLKPGEENSLYLAPFAAKYEQLKNSD